MDAKCFGISMWEHITHTAHKHVDYSWHAYVVIYAIQREKNEPKKIFCTVMIPQHYQIFNKFFELHTAAYS